MLIHLFQIMSCRHDQKLAGIIDWVETVDSMALRKKERICRLSLYGHQCMSATYYGLRFILILLI